MSDGVFFQSAVNQQNKQKSFDLRESGQQINRDILDQRKVEHTDASNLRSKQDVQKEFATSLKQLKELRAVGGEQTQQQVNTIAEKMRAAYSNQYDQYGMASENVNQMIDMVLNSPTALDQAGLQGEMRAKGQLSHAKGLQSSGIARSQAQSSAGIQQPARPKEKAIRFNTDEGKLLQDIETVRNIYGEESPQYKMMESKLPKPAQELQEGEIPAPDISNLTKGEIAGDKQFSKVRAKFIENGGFADIEKNLTQLKHAFGVLENNNVSGPLIGMTPDVALSLINPKAIDTRDQIAEVTQRNLRAVLGGQFAQKEGEQLIQRAYDPKLSEDINKRRVSALIMAVEKAAITKAQSMQYFDEHGTLKGYAGTITPSFKDIENDFDNFSSSLGDDNDPIEAELRRRREGK